MRRPRLLDLFCCAGGAGMGYHQAGFDVFGVDLRWYSRYPFIQVQADCLGLSQQFLRQFDAIHASPPCQHHTSMKTMPDAREHADLVPATRTMLKASGVPYVIENVMGAPLIDPIVLCGSMFDLGVKGAQLRRHRQFEANFPLTPPGRAGTLSRRSVFTARDAAIAAANTTRRSRNLRWSTAGRPWVCPGHPSRKSVRPFRQLTPASLAGS